MNKPFQTFDEQGDASQSAPRMRALRNELAKRGVDGFMIPRSDEHQGEYVPKRAERLAFLTGFTGSAGPAGVLMEKAAGFVDGRYTLQLEEQTHTRPVEKLDPTQDRAADPVDAEPAQSAQLRH